MPKGPTLLELMWAQLDRLMRQLLDDGPTQKERETWEYHQLIGRAQGVAFCIATVVNPYKTDVDAVRREAMERYNGS
jgi:hypothetical protein